MNTLTAAGWAIAAGMIGVAAAAEPAERQLVLILENYQIVDHAMLGRAKPIAARMFAEIGVRVEWCISGSCRQKSADRCGRVTVPVVFKTETPRNVRRGVLAF